MAFDFGSHFFFQNRVVSYQSPKESLVGLHGSPRGWLRVLALFTIVPLAGATIMGFNHTLADVPSQHRWKTWPFLPWRLKKVFIIFVYACVLVILVALLGMLHILHSLGYVCMHVVG